MNDTVSHLNAVLKVKLTGINQYFLHARILKHMGLMALADYEYRTSLGAMKDADQLVNRILSLSGLPNLQELDPLRIGATPPEMLEGDLELAEATRSALKSAQGETAFLQPMLAVEEEHIAFLHSQLATLSKAA